jgi:hypothetical protein
MQVDGNAPLKLELELRRLPRARWGFMSLVLLAIAVIAGRVMPRQGVA